MEENIIFSFFFAQRHHIYLSLLYFKLHQLYYMKVAWLENVQHHLVLALGNDR